MLVTADSLIASLSLLMPALLTIMANTGPALLTIMATLFSINFEGKAPVDPPLQTQSPVQDKIFPTTALRYMKIPARI